MLARVDKRKTKLHKLGVIEEVKVHAAKDEAEEQKTRILSRRKISAMAASLSASKHPLLIKQELLTIVSIFQRDLVPERVDACMIGSIAEPEKQLGTLSVVFVGDANTLRMLNPATSDEDGVTGWNNLGRCFRYAVI